MEHIELREQEWIVTTDTVMGGLSTLSVIQEAEGVRLQGLLNHENNGGFVSTRMKDATISCPKSALGVRAFWKGDDRPYRLILHEKDRRVREYFECTLSQYPSTLLWNDFKHRYKNTNDEERQFAPHQLTSIGILLSKTHSGAVDFYLERLEWVLP